MCLAIPGKLIAVAQDQNGVRMGRANFAGIIKEVCLEYTPEAECGDYVLVHVGFALGKVDEEEARRTYEALESLNQLGDLDTPGIEEGESPLGLGPPRTELEANSVAASGSKSSTVGEVL